MKIHSTLVKRINNLHKPTIIGISGFGGAGKSTFATALGSMIDSPVIGVDSFQKDKSNLDFTLWKTMDFKRLETQVLTPFKQRANELEYGVFDWGTNGVGNYKKIIVSDILIVEGVGLFRPEINDYLDYKIWIDCPLDEADGRGRKRDEFEYKNLHDEAFYKVWKENDRQYLETYQPDKVADLVISNLVPES